MSPPTTNGDVLADGRQSQRVDNYTKFWQKDLGKEADIDNKNRIDSYTDVVNGELGYPQFFFSVVSHHNTFFFRTQDTTMAQRNSMNTAGANLSTSPGSTRANPSPPPSLVTSTTSLLK